MSRPLNDGRRYRLSLGHGAWRCTQPVRIGKDETSVLRRARATRGLESRRHMCLLSAHRGRKRPIWKSTLRKASRRGAVNYIQRSEM